MVTAPSSAPKLSTGETPIVHTFASLEGAVATTNFTGFTDALKSVNALASDVGTINGTHNPVKVFVPWSLARTIGEWHFRRDNKDPSVVLDEHWWMTPDYDNRSTYKDRPRHDLIGTNIVAEDYVKGPLEDWVDGALRLDYGKSLSTELRIPESARELTGLVVEMYVKIIDDEQKPGPLVKTDKFALYADHGCLRFQVGDKEVNMSYCRETSEWLHIFADYENIGGTFKVRIYLNGKQYNGLFGGYSVNGNRGDTLVQLAPTQNLTLGGETEFEIEFLRIALSSLEESQTTIEELYAWQFDGPHLRDFTGKAVSEKHALPRPAGALDK